VAVRNASTTDSYLDFSDGQFKTAGWVTKYASMTHVENGLYLNVFDVASLSLPAGTFLSVEYAVDEPGVVGTTYDMLLLTTSTYSVAPTGSMVEEIHRVLGLDPNYPLVVSRTQRQAGNVRQAIETDVPVAGSVTVTRE
jgi:hypothetical protein